MEATHMSTSLVAVSAFDASLVLLATVLFYTVLIERLTEIVKALFDVLEYTGGWRKSWNRAAQSLANTLDAQRSQGRVRAELSKAVDDYLSVDYPGLEGIEVLSAERLRLLVLRVAIKVVAVLLGVLVALGMDINIFDVLHSMNTSINAMNSDPEAAVNVYFSSDRIPDWLGMILTGVAMGLGSDPVHRVISRLEKSRKHRVEPDKPTE